MDYKYIEQLLERYWECQTTREEEAILRTFFRQEDVPASLLPYRQLFLEEDKMAAEHLGKDFQDRMLRMVGEEESLPSGRFGGGHCKARRLTFVRRMRPFCRAAGLVAVFLTIGNAAHQSFTDEEQPPMANGECSMVDGGWSMDNGQWSMVNGQCSIRVQPEQQSAELMSSPIDTINALTR